MVKRVLQLLLLTALSAGSASATPLGVVQNSFPDITTQFVTVSYVPGAGDTGLFGATGFAFGFKFSDDSPVEITNGLTVITAQLASSGNSVLSGTIEISGSISALSVPQGNLLTGTLLAFGFDGGSGDPFDFIFEATGGSLLPFYGGMNSLFTTFLSSGTTNLSDFGSEFHNDFGAGLANTATPVPEPSTALLLAVGLLATTGAVRRSRER
jgi:hypothetical protein